MKNLLRFLFLASVTILGIAAISHAADAPSISNTRQLSAIELGAVSASCADNDAGTANSCTLSFPGVHTVLYTCLDANGCTAVLSETGAWDGFSVTVVNKSANTVTVGDSAGVTELAGAAALGQWDTLTVGYATDRYVELARSNN